MELRGGCEIDVGGPPVAALNTLTIQYSPDGPLAAAKVGRESVGASVSAKANRDQLVVRFRTPPLVLALASCAGVWA